MSTWLQISMLADKNGGFARLLGVDINVPEDKGPHSQRSDSSLPAPSKSPAKKPTISSLIFQDYVSI